MPPLLSPMTYRSIIRPLQQTYSTKCPITSPAANKCVEILYHHYTLYSPSRFNAPQTGVSGDRIRPNSMDRPEGRGGEEKNLEGQHELMSNKYQDFKNTTC